jgi:hypothetical protein
MISAESSRTIHRRAVSRVSASAPAPILPRTLTPRAPSGVPQRLHRLPELVPGPHPVPGTDVRPFLCEVLDLLDGVGNKVEAFQPTRLLVLKTELVSAGDHFTVVRSFLRPTSRSYSM